LDELKDGVSEGDDCVCWVVEGDDNEDANGDAEGSWDMDLTEKSELVC
jgi:hypothetical protein